MNTGNAAIWWRVSTDDQREMSPDTQVQGALALAVKEGYQVAPEHIMGTDWASLEVWNSPPMSQMKELITSGIVGAVFMYHSDRLPSKPAHRLAFRALCEESGVAIRCVFGEVPEGEMSEFMDFAMSWAKEQQVLRAQQGARDGQRDRAKLRGLPVNGKAPYGYKFRYSGEGASRTMTALGPDPVTYPIACRIWQMAKEGYTSSKIARALNADAIPTAKGALGWHRMTIQHLLGNPLYAGVYHALRSEKRQPRDRRNNKSGYGKTSTFTKPANEWHPLPDFPVESPIVTMEEFQVLQHRLSDNKLNASRRAKRSYLLKGLLFCEADGKRMVGYTNKRSQWPRYRCGSQSQRASGLPCCGRPSISGRVAERLVWEKVRDFLLEPEMFYAEMNRRIDGTHTKEDEVMQRIQSLERRITDVVRRETELVALRLRGLVSDVALDRNASLLKAERSHIQDEIGRQEAELTALRESQAGAEAIKLLRERMVDKLNSASPEDRRFILEAVDTRVIVKQDKTLEIFVNQTPRCLVHKWGL